MHPHVRLTAKASVSRAPAQLVAPDLQRRREEFAEALLERGIDATISEPLSPFEPGTLDGAAPERRLK